MPEEKEQPTSRPAAEHAPKSKTHRPQFPDNYYQDPTGIDRYVVQEKPLFEWRAPSKIDRKRTKSEQTQIMLIVLFCVLVTVLLGEILVAVMFAVLAALYFIVMTSKPLYLDCLITTLGVKVGEKYYFWSDMSQFWFENRGESRVMYLRVVYPNLQKIRLIIHKPDEEEIQTKMGMYLLYKKPQQTSTEKLIKAVGDKLPIDLEFLQL